MTPDERLARIAAGEEPKFVARLASGFVVMGDTQALPGYCLLLAYPKVGQLNDLEGEARTQFLADMAKVGDAVKAVTGCVRCNYSIYGNLDPFLHAHVWPRYSNEADEFRTLPPLTIPNEWRAATPFDPEIHRELQQKIAEKLAELG